MFTTLIVFQVLLAAGLIAIVLVQRGPGATMGAAFGAGASGTVFGSRGAGNFLTRTTGWLAMGFFGISLTLAVLATGVGSQVQESALTGSVLEGESQQQAEPADEADALDAVIDSFDAADDGEAGDVAEQGEEEQPLPEPPAGE
ncbi:MAG: preprotein translocase subunit SecG [Wenzhouxiangellaceae bacterium]